LIAVIIGQRFSANPDRHVIDEGRVKSTFGNLSGNDFPTRERMMNISDRSKYSLCQLLELFSDGKVATLLRKHGLPVDELEIHSNINAQIDDVPASVRDEILRSPPTVIGNILEEIGRKHDSFRQKVAPRKSFDQHWQDLSMSLLLDGYRAEEIPEHGTVQYQFVRIDPAIHGIEPIEDDLTKELGQSGLPDSDEICRMLRESGSAFCEEDFNACLSKVRIALERIAVGMANSMQKESENRSARWGHAVAFLRQSGNISEQEETCLTGVYGFISPGSHVPVGADEMEFVRMGRNLSFTCCYFLVKRLNSDR